MTPTTVAAAPLMTSCFPERSGSPPKARRQKPSPTITAGGVFSRRSSGAKPRPARRPPPEGAKKLHQTPRSPHRQRLGSDPHPGRVDVVFGEVLHRAVGGSQVVEIGIGQGSVASLRAHLPDLHDPV